MIEVSPLVSVIVTTRNSGKTLAACLTSIRSQLYAHIELIVIDNKSTDQTLQIARLQSDILETFGPERSAQRNRGAKLARGSYLLFIDSDMTLTPTVVTDCEDALRASAAPAAVIPEISIGDGFVARCIELERSCYVGDDTVEAARFFTRSAFEEVGGFDENLTGPEDWDLTLRVRAGKTLPRTASHIVHDEGRLRLSTLLAKKRYYARSMPHYTRKHGRLVFKQANVVFRPAFARNWRRFARHPVLALGVIGVKSLETIAVISGLRWTDRASRS